MKILVIAGLVSGICLGQPVVEGRWCDQPCKSSTVAGTFDYPPPKKASPVKKKRRVAQQAVPEVPQAAITPSEELPIQLAEPDHKPKPVMRNLAVWLFSLLLATAAVAVPAYLFMSRRAAARSALLHRNKVDLIVVKLEVEQEKKAPGGPDENTQLQPADVNAALPVIREFTQNRQKGLS